MNIHATDGFLLSVAIPTSIVTKEFLQKVVNRLKLGERCHVEKRRPQNHGQLKVNNTKTRHK